MAKPPKKPEKDREMQREDEILRRMLDTPPKPRDTKKRPKGDKGTEKANR